MSLLATLFYKGNSLLTVCFSFYVSNFKVLFLWLGMAQCHAVGSGSLGSTEMTSSHRGQLLRVRGASPGGVRRMGWSLSSSPGLFLARLGLPHGGSTEVLPHNGGLSCCQNPGQSGPGDRAGEVPGRRVRAAPPVSHQVGSQQAPLCCFLCDLEAFSSLRSQKLCALQGASGGLAGCDLVAAGRSGSFVGAHFPHRAACHAACHGGFCRADLPAVRACVWAGRVCGSFAFWKRFCLGG